MASSGRNEGVRVLEEFVTDAIVPEGQLASQIDRGSREGLRDIGAIRDAFVVQRRQVHAANGTTPDEFELESEWHCSEEFAILLTEGFHRAKIAALSETHNRNIPKG